jgi:hypothetical protein
VEGAHVAYHGAWGDAVVTGDDGRWRFGRLRPAEGVLVQANHREFLPGTAGPFPVQEGVDRQVPDIVLRRGVRLEVEVLGADGAPKPGAMVGWSEASLPGANRLTDERGRADLGPMAPGYVVVSVSLRGHRSEAHRVLLEGEGVGHLEPFRLALETDED